MKKKDSFRLAHISDLHFFDNAVHWKDMFSKRALGHLNATLFRKNIHSEEPLLQIPELFKALDLDGVVITGDISSTSQIQEFEKAKQWLQQFPELKTFIVPGNHDAYTKKSFREKACFQTLSFNEKGIGSLQEDGLELHHIFENWWLILLDTAVPTAFFSSGGLFSKKLEEKLSYLLSHLDQNQSIILASHFPIVNCSWRKKLFRSSKLLEICKKHPHIKLYLHGHLHSSALVDLREENLPICIDSGSLSHKDKGGWNFLEFNTSNAFSYKQYLWQNDSWKINTESSFQW